MGPLSWYTKSVWNNMNILTKLMIITLIACPLWENWDLKMIKEPDINEMVGKFYMWDISCSYGYFGVTVWKLQVT